MTDTTPVTTTRPVRAVGDRRVGSRPGPGAPAPWLVALLSVQTVSPLLGWVYGIAPFHVLFLTISLPATIAVGAIGVWLALRRPASPLRRALRIGVVAGLVGTVGYDLFRVPFVVAGGMRLLSPIESYGVLLADAGGSSGLTALLGWSYHVSNGVLFAVSYAVLAFGRRWHWGVTWALTLETATVITPFADVYQLRGQLLPLVLAYAAHVPYGLALGLLVERGDETAAWLDRRRLTVTRILSGVAVALLLWLQPWVPAASTAGRGVATVTSGRLVPQFSRVPAGACVPVVNSDRRTRVLTAPATAVTVPPAGRTRLCLPPGVHRVRTTGQPFEGGFVIVDPLVEEVV